MVAHSVPSFFQYKGEKLKRYRYIGRQIPACPWTSWDTTARFPFGRQDKYRYTAAREEWHLLPMGGKLVRRLNRPQYHGQPKQKRSIRRFFFSVIYFTVPCLKYYPHQHVFLYEYIKLFGHINHFFSTSIRPRSVWDHRPKWKPSTKFSYCVVKKAVSRPLCVCYYYDCSKIWQLKICPNGGHWYGQEHNFGGWWIFIRRLVDNGGV